MKKTSAILVSFVLALLWLVTVPRPARGDSSILNKAIPACLPKAAFDEMERERLRLIDLKSRVNNDVTRFNSRCAAVVRGAPTFDSCMEEKAQLAGQVKKFGRMLDGFQTRVAKTDQTCLELEQDVRTVVPIMEKDHRQYRGYVDQLTYNLNHPVVPPEPESKWRDVKDGLITGIRRTREKTCAELLDDNGVIKKEMSPLPGMSLNNLGIFATAPMDEKLYEFPRGVLDSISGGGFTFNTEYGQQLVNQMRNKRFERLLAHSNGATIAEALIRADIIAVEELQLIGADRSLGNFRGLEELIQSGKVKRIIVWYNPGDPVPVGTVYPTPELPFSRIVRAATAHIMGQSQPDPSQSNRPLRLPWVEAVEGIALAAAGHPRVMFNNVEYRCLIGKEYTEGQKFSFDAHKMLTYFRNMGIWSENHKINSK